MASALQTLNYFLQWIGESGEPLLLAAIGSSQNESDISSFKKCLAKLFCHKLVPLPTIDLFLAAIIPNSHPSTKKQDNNHLVEQGQELSNEVLETYTRFSIVNRISLRLRLQMKRSCRKSSLSQTAHVTSPKQLGPYILRVFNQECVSSTKLKHCIRAIDIMRGMRKTSLTPQQFFSEFIRQPIANDLKGLKATRTTSVICNSAAEYLLKESDFSSGDSAISQLISWARNPANALPASPQEEDHKAWYSPSPLSVRGEYSASRTSTASMESFQLQDLQEGKKNDERASGPSNLRGNFSRYSPRESFGLSSSDIASNDPPEESNSTSPLTVRKTFSTPERFLLSCEIPRSPTLTAARGHTPSYSPRSLPVISPSSLGQTSLDGPPLAEYTDTLGNTLMSMWPEIASRLRKHKVKEISGVKINKGIIPLPIQMFVDETTNKRHSFNETNALQSRSVEGACRYVDIKNTDDIPWYAKPVNWWTVEEVGKWLTSIRMAELRGSFTQHVVDGSALLHIAETSSLRSLVRRHKSSDETMRALLNDVAKLARDPFNYSENFFSKEACVSNETQVAALKVMIRRVCKWGGS